MRFAVRIHQSQWTYSQLETVWQESERLGYDGASLYDVLGVPGPECWTALTALTRATQKLVAVPLVLSNPYRHPAVVAKMAAWGLVVPTMRPRPSGCHGPLLGIGSRRLVRLSR